MSLEQKIRKRLADRASAANSPFLADQDAFYGFESTDSPPPSRVLTIIEDEYLPNRDQVARTKLFAFSALAIGSFTVNGQQSKPPPHPMFSELQGFPTNLFPGEKKENENKSEVGGGYNRLVKYANSLLTRIRSELFTKLAEEMAGSSSYGGMLLRIGPLLQNDHVSLGSLIECNNLDIAVGLDTTQPDVGEQDIFSEIKHLSEFRQQSEYAFRCMSDQQITALLREKERTGLFWRYGGRPPTSSAYSVGSCYARLGEKRYSPVRLDIVAREGELPKQISNVVSCLASSLITPGSHLLKSISSVLGGDSVAVPQFAEKLLAELYEKRVSPDSKFHEFYRDQEAKLP